MMNVPDPFTALRLNSIFGNSPTFPDQGVINQESLPEQDQPDQNLDVAQRMSELYKPQNAMTQQYLDALRSFPNPQNFRPSGLRRVGAVLAALGTGGPAGIADGAPIGYQGNPSGAMQVAEAYNRMPYNRALQDWQTKTGALGEGARSEQIINQGNRQYSEQLMRNELTDKLRDIQQQNANTNSLKNQQIFETKIAQLEQNAQKMEDQAQHWKEVLDQNKNNQEAIQAFHTAQLGATQARFELDQARRTKEFNDTLERLNKQHTDDIEKWKAQLEESKRRTDFLNSPLVRSTTATRDASGQVISSTTRSERERPVASHQEPIRPMPSHGAAPQNTLRKEIPGHPGKFAISRDGGKTWIAE